MPVSPARAAAFEILLRIEKTDAYASELLHSAQFAKLSPADHGLLTELVMGVLRWRSVLDGKIADLSSQPIAKFDTKVLTALRLGAYQILFLDRIPRHAAVNESVELVKTAHKRSASGLVNAVLRRINRKDPPPDDNFAHSLWLVEKWNRSYGPGTTKKICTYDQGTPRTAIRVFHPALPAELLDEGIQLEPGRILSAAFTVTSGEITRTKAFRERRLIIQDEASQLVALLVGRGTNILDCCAAPGGKTRIIAERNPQATIFAMELHPRRAALLRKLVAAANVHVIAADARSMPFRRNFDCILVDAPCSGTGTLARNPEIKWRLKPEDLLRLREYQAEILRSAMERVAPGGRIVYSTCSLEPEENEQVIELALTANPPFRLLNCRDELHSLQASADLRLTKIDSLVNGPYLRTIPGIHPCDGFFAAIIARE
jgi:16S rRNA (cytosine967-C5)-methyltransferase